MKPLNLPEHPLQTRSKPDGKTEVFDQNRKKYVVLTPEEWVRQQFIAYLVHHKNYPANLISIEKGLKVNRLNKRFDAVVFNRSGLPFILLEFKAPEIKITEKTFSQIGAYNSALQVNYLMVSNGLSHYCCKFNPTDNSFTFLDNIPEFSALEDS